MKSFKDTVSKFYSMQESLALDEVLTAKTPTSKWIDDFVNSDNPKFAGKSKKERIQMALGAAYAAKRQNEELEIDLEEVDRLAESFDIEIINEVTADDWLKGAEEARVDAMKAKSENKMPEFHEHMADHHEHLINYHELKGNQKNADAHYKKMMQHMEDESRLSEGVDLEEAKSKNYQLYHPSYTDAIQHALEHHKSASGLSVSDDDYYNHVSIGQKKPSADQTVSHRLPATNQKGEHHIIDMQIYNRGAGKTPFELNTYSSKIPTKSGRSMKEELEEVFPVEEEFDLDEMVGASMGNTRKLTHHIQGLGWKLARTTGSHDVFTHSKSEQHIAVPRHKELKAPLVLSILKIAKVPKLAEEVEELDELSKKTLGSYIEKSSHDDEDYDGSKSVKAGREAGVTKAAYRTQGLSHKPNTAGLFKKYTAEETEIDEGRGFRGVNGARYREDDENHALDKGNWYIRAHGKNLTDAKGTLIPFSSMAAANAHALKHADKHGIPLTAMHLTKSWMDAPDKMAEAYMPAISASIAGSQGSMGRASAKAALLRKRAQGKTTPRNFVAKHAPTTGAGSHGNKKKENKDSHSFMEDSVVEAKKMKDTDPCWTGYEMVGTKKKNGKEVPNCVPSVKEDIEQIDELSKKTLSSYMNKADTNVRDLSRKWVSGTKAQKDAAYAKIDKKISDRLDSMDKAVTKLKESSIVPAPTHVVVDSKTGAVVSKHASLKTASRSANRRDQEYGAVRYIVKPITK